MSLLYEKQILRILLDVGARGISVKKLAKHVYNLSCTLFSQPEFDEVYRQVQYYIYSRSRSSKSIIENTGRRGYYRLNMRSSTVSQLMIDFNASDGEGQPDEPEKPAPDLSLSLFD